MRLTNWNYESITGHKPQTTIYLDFSLAEICGEDAIRNTYRSAMRAWKDNYIYLTELVMALNWKIFEHYKRNQPLSLIYNELWLEADSYAKTHLKGNELMYFYSITD